MMTEPLMTEQLIYGLTGIVLFALGVRALLLQRELLRRVLAVNIMGAGVFMLLITVAYHGRYLPADPVPHALVLTGIVVAVSATALALMLGRRLSEKAGDE
jgi:multicomponent Na+:H+ antiporter subunit C